MALVTVIVGKPALGYKTRKAKNRSNKYIVRRRSGK